MLRGGQRVGKAMRRRGLCRRRRAISPKLDSAILRTRKGGERGAKEWWIWEVRWKRETGGYGDDEIEEMGLSETDIWSPEFDS
jgi:hypothetical protein